jgi:putative ABC transport system substrate-binding protein
MPVVGFANGQSPAVFAYLAAFREGLGQNGYVEGQSVAIEYRWGEGQESRMPALIDELVRKPVDVLVLGGFGSAPTYAKLASSKVPVVTPDGNDPVQDGLVASLNRPGGNIAVVWTYTSELEGKRLEILHKLLPQAQSFGVLVAPSFTGTARQVEDLNAAAAAQHLQISVFHASSAPELEAAFADMAKAGVGAVAIAAGPFFNGYRSQLVALSAHYSLPSMFETRQFAEAGGLISYGPSIEEAYRQLGVYAGRILKGEKPGDLPVVQPSKFDLVINLKTAKTLGIEIPPTLLALADKVVE